MKPPPFRLESPDTVDEVLARLAELGDEAKLIAGGQSLMPLLAFRLARPDVLIDLTRVQGLEPLTVDGRNLTVGALTTHRTVERAGLVPAAIVSAVQHIGHVGIRNRGTVGGSLAHADPSAEWAAIALAHDGVVVAASQSGERRIPATDFFFDLWSTALHPDEMVRELVLTLPVGPYGGSFLEFARRHGDFAVAGVYALLSGGHAGTITQARLSVMGAGRIPTRCRDAERFLEGRPLESDAIGEAVRLAVAGIEPRGDDDDERLHRIQVTGTLMRRAIDAAGRQLATAAGA